MRETCTPSGFNSLTRYRAVASPSTSALNANPNRYRGLYGAARAAEMAGDRPKAVGYYEKLVALASKADTARPEIARAKAFIGAR